MKRGIRSWAGALLAAAALGACSTVQVGQNFDLKTFETRAERNVTTQAQVRSWLGEPGGKGIAVEAGGERFEEWTYFFAKGQLPSMQGMDLKMLQVRFERNGTLRSFSFTTSDK